MVYKHTQRSYLTIPFVILLAFLTFNPMTGKETAWPHLVVVASLAVAVLLFSTLTVKIVNSNLIWHFTLGFGKKSVPVAEIRNMQSSATTGITAGASGKSGTAGFTMFTGWTPSNCNSPAATSFASEPTNPGNCRAQLTRPSQQKHDAK